LGERGTPRLIPDQVIAILKRHGFRLAGQTGSHQKWLNPTTGRQVIVPYHRRVLSLGTMKSIVKGSGIPLLEWFD
jgi:mRNA interferase HicA